MARNNRQHKYLHTFGLLPCLLLVTVGCGEPQKSQRDPLKGLGDNNTHFDKPSLDNKLVFPREHTPHKSYQQEWWYLTANLITEDGQSLATQWTLFRRGIEDKHWYFAHAALADSKAHESGYRQGREEQGNVEITDVPFSATIDDWRWQARENSKGDLLPAQLNYGSHAQINKHNDGIENGDNTLWSVKLNLSSGTVNTADQNSSRYFLQGDQGYSQKHHTQDISSHYYSHPFIEVSGEVYWQSRWQKVSGHAWLDREWGSQMLAEDQQGWDWFSLRLDQDTALMIYRIRSTLEDYIYGSVMTRNGEITVLSTSDINVVSKPVSNTSSFFGNSADNVNVYPESFTLEVKSQNIKLDVNVVNNQQIMRYGVEYFEGMVTFSGTHRGQGFLEMTGYN